MVVSNAHLKDLHLLYVLFLKKKSGLQRPCSRRSNRKQNGHLWSLIWNVNCNTYPRGGVLGSIFAGYVPLAYPDPYPIIVYSVANYRPHVSHFWANIPQISTCRNLLTPEIPQMCDPILVTLLAPNENATPS